MREILLNDNLIAFVDDCDFERISQFKWSASWSEYTKSFYARRWVKGGKGKRVYLHRDVLNVVNSVFVDHINLNTLDCRKSNLRIATRSQNGFNRNAPSNNKSGVKGVYWDSKNSKWRAQIVVNGKKYQLGRFIDLNDAANAYAKAANKFAKEFARISILN